MLGGVGFSNMLVENGLRQFVVKSAFSSTPELQGEVHKTQIIQLLCISDIESHRQYTTGEKFMIISFICFLMGELKECLLMTQMF